MGTRGGVSKLSAAPTFPAMSAGTAVSATGAVGVPAAVVSAKAGEEAGWEALFDRFYPSVLRFAMARLGDPDAAEEVAQEVFVSAVGSIGSLRDHREPAVEAWFLRITRYRAIDRLRRRRADDSELPEDLSAADDPAEAATSRLHAAEVRRAMDGLTEEQRDLLIRRFVLDQSLEQVAAATNRRVGAVKSMQHRALAMLAKRLPATEPA